MNNNQLKFTKLSMFITMFINRSIHVYIYRLVHTFYNTSVAKNVTPHTLKHTLVTTNPQVSFFRPHAVKPYRDSLILHTQYTGSTTTIFNKVGNNTNT
jgi:hypothetical protein